MKSQQSVAAAYRKEIAVPESRIPRQCFVCPVGLPGAGKTTVLTSIAERLGLVRISSDELRRRLKEAGHGWDELKELLEPIVHEFAAAGHSIAFDMDCGSPRTIEIIERESKDAGAVVFWLHIDTPEAFVFEKFRKHPPSWLAEHPEEMIENYREQKARREREGRRFDFTYVFDTSRDGLPQQIEACIDTITNTLEYGQTNA